jgi:AraC-like DNA-binding protein
MPSNPDEARALRTGDLDEAIEAVTRIYCPHTVEVVGRARGIDAFLKITHTTVADHLGISLRSLQAGFRRWRETTPTAFLRQARLQLVRDELLRSGPEANVTTVALRHSFSHLGRFSAQYRSAFGEDPSATLRRGRAALARR